MANHARWIVLSSVLCVAAAGCGGPAAGDVSGTINYDGTPIPMGTVTFLPAKGERKSAAINDGKYNAEAVPVGEAKVFIVLPAAPPAAGGPTAGKVPWEKKGPPKDANVPAGFDFSKVNKVSSSIKLPADYTDPEKTPLKYTVVAGKQTKDFDVPK